MKNTSHTKEFVREQRRHRLQICASYLIETYRSKSGLLKAPVKGSMNRRIAESVDATLKLTVTNKHATVIFEGTSSIAGLEIVGNMDELV